MASSTLAGAALAGSQCASTPGLQTASTAQRRSTAAVRGSFSGAEQSKTAVLRTARSSKAATLSAATPSRTAVVAAAAAAAAVNVAVVEKSLDQEAAAVASNIPGWHNAKVLRVEEASAAGVRNVVLEVETSRELVALEDAYTCPGQTASVKLSSDDAEIPALVASAPFPHEINKSVLYKLRGDIPAGTTKLAQYTLSARSELHLYVQEDQPQLYSLREGDEIFTGPFKGDAMSLKPVYFLARNKTILIFARGSGIATARAVLEATSVGGLQLHLRNDTRLYYSSAAPDQVAYQDRFGDWESRKCVVRATVDDAAGSSWSGSVGSLADLFDADDVEYDPDTTSAIVCGEEAINAGVLDLLQQAGIPEEKIVRL